MIYYVVLEPYKLPEGESQFCEYVMPVFGEYANARLIYPDAQVMEVNICEVNPQDN